MSDLKIIVTGGAGFIGSHIVDHWVGQQCEVHVIDNFRTGRIENVNSNAHLHRVSITDKEAVFDILRGASYVFHLAAMVSVEESIREPQTCIDINVSGLLNVLEASRVHRIRKVVLSSSCAVYGDNGNVSQCESAFPSPQTPYAISKLDGEFWQKFYREYHGLPTASLRYFNVYGPRQSVESTYAAVIPIFIDRAAKEYPITIYGDGQQTRDFIYVDDVVRANVLAAMHATTFDAANVGSGQSVSILKLAQEIISLTHSSSKIRFESARGGDIQFSRADLSKARSELQFEPSFDLLAGLQKTVAKFQAT